MEATLENKLSVQVQSGSVLYSCDRKALIEKHGLKNVACRIEKGVPTLTLSGYNISMSVLEAAKQDSLQTIEDNVRNPRPASTPTCDVGRHQYLMRKKFKTSESAAQAPIAMTMPQPFGGGWMPMGYGGGVFGGMHPMMGNMMAHGGVFLGNSMPMPPGLPLHPFVGNYPPMGSTGYPVPGIDGYGSVPDIDSDESDSTCRSLSETKPLHLQEKVKEAEEQLRVAKKKAKDAEKDELTKASEAAERATSAEKKAREEAVAKHAELACKQQRAWDKAAARDMEKEKARKAKKDERETKPVVVLQPRGPKTPEPVVLKQVNCRMRSVSIVTIGYNGLGFSWQPNRERKVFRGPRGLEAAMLAQIDDDMHVDVFFDCSMFGSRRCAAGHCGTHAKIIHGVVHHNKFTKELQGFMWRLSRVPLIGDPDDKEIEICCVCPRGTKRAVAGGIILEHLLTWAGHGVVSLRNLDEKNYSNHMHWCSQCQDYGHPVREEALTDALLVWQSL